MLIHFIHYLHHKLSTKYSFLLIHFRYAKKGLELKKCSGSSGPPPNWFLSDKSESCEQVCSKNNLSCSVTGMKAIDSNTKMAFLAGAFGISCTYLSGGDFYWPGIDAYDTCVWGSSTACGSSHYDVKRFCCCGITSDFMCAVA